MADMEKVIKALRICFMQKACDGCPYQKELKAILDKPHNDDWHCPIFDDALALLKKQEAQKFFVDESGKIIPLPVVVRCKDCIHRGKSEKCVLAAISEEKDFPLFMLDNRGDWFCADGKRRTK